MNLYSRANIKQPPQQQNEISMLNKNMNINQTSQYDILYIVLPHSSDNPEYSYWCIYHKVNACMIHVINTIRYTTYTSAAHQVPSLI